tara:strand:+ start:189 stop:461 length:273 start_codon:yes stop_codon:yes gene_type:complete
MKFKFNDIANAISVISGVSLAGIIGVGSYVYLNKDAIIDDIKDAAIESVVGGMGAGALGGAGALDLKLPADQASTPPSAGLGLTAPNNPF